MPQAEFGQDGALRVGLFPSFFYRRTETGLQGVAIEIASALSAQSGLRLAAVEYSAPPDVVRALTAGECDVAFLGIDPARGADVDFTPAFLRADFSFLVPAGVSAGSIAEIDGLRIAIVRHHAMDTALSGQLPGSARVYAATPDEAFALLRAGQADVLAGIRPGLMTYAGRLSGARVLPDRYGANVLALAVAKGKASGLDVVTRFVRDAVDSGLVRDALARAGLAGIDVIGGTQ